MLAAHLTSESIYAVIQRHCLEGFEKQIAPVSAFVLGTYVGEYADHYMPCEIKFADGTFLAMQHVKAGEYQSKVFPPENTPVDMLRMTVYRGERELGRLCSSDADGSRGFSFDATVLHKPDDVLPYLESAVFHAAAIEPEDSAAYARWQDIRPLLFSAVRALKYGGEGVQHYYPGAELIQIPRCGVDDITEIEYRSV